MIVRRFALIFGILYLVVGVVAFIPGLTIPGTGLPDLLVGAGYGNLLGIFPVNAIHDIVHIAVGIFGLALAGTFARAQLFARGLAIVYGLLTVIGFIPGFSTLFGLAPLFGPDIALHAVSAIVAAYFGWGVADSTSRAAA
jgi:hypothetical protein